MKALVVLNPNMLGKIDHKILGSVGFGELDVLFGIVNFDKPTFDTSIQKNDDYVLVKVDAFSCNYRDKAILVHNYQIMLEQNRLFLPFGSEFCGTIVDKGNNVNEFEIGEKVISNCAYEDLINTDISPGIATNFASLGWLRIYRKKIIRKPVGFKDEEAACFSLGAQTAYSMIRRSGIFESEVKKPIVFSSGSATSSFIIQQLKALGIKPVCFSSKKTNRVFQDNLKELTYDVIENIDKYMCQASHVYDPFFDLNILNAVNTLTVGGKYIYCGLFEQHPLLAINNISFYSKDLREALKQSIVKNISIIGNCLGTTGDLRSAIDLYERNNLKPVIDTEFTLNEGIDFIEKTFMNRNKAGKCVLMYK